MKNLMTHVVVAAALCTAGSMALAAFAKDEGKSNKPTTREALPTILRNTLDKQIRAMGAEDLEKAMSVIHTKSPVYSGTRRGTEQIFTKYDLRYKLLSFTYIGRDKDYAVVRARQKTSKVAGPAFRDNIIDMMHIFRKEGRTWKVWQSTILEVEFLPLRQSP